MKTHFKPVYVRLASSLITAVLLIFAAQAVKAQELSKSSKENAIKEIQTEKLKIEKEPNLTPEKSSTKSLQETKTLQKEQAETDVESKKTFEKEKKESESTKTSKADKKLAEIKKYREEIELRKKHGKLSEKEYQDAVNKLDKMEKELKSKSKPKLDSKGGK